MNRILYFSCENRISPNKGASIIDFNTDVSILDLIEGSNIWIVLCINLCGEGNLMKNSDQIPLDKRDRHYGFQHLKSASLKFLKHGKKFGI